MWVIFMTQSHVMIEKLELKKAEPRGKGFEKTKS
jgi:hypothetical protein